MIKIFNCITEENKILSMNFQFIFPWFVGLLRNVPLENGDVKVTGEALPKHGGGGGAFFNPTLLKPLSF